MSQTEVKIEGIENVTDIQLRRDLEYLAKEYNLGVTVKNRDSFILTTDRTIRGYLLNSFKRFGFYVSGIEVRNEEDIGIQAIEVFFER